MATSVCNRKQRDFGALSRGGLRSKTSEAPNTRVPRAMRDSSLVIQRNHKQPPEGPSTKDPSIQESHPDHGRVLHD